MARNKIKYTPTLPLTDEQRQDREWIRAQLTEPEVLWFNATLTRWIRARIDVIDQTPDDAPQVEKNESQRLFRDYVAACDPCITRHLLVTLAVERAKPELPPWERRKLDSHPEDTDHA